MSSNATNMSLYIQCSLQLDVIFNTCNKKKQQPLGETSFKGCIPNSFAIADAIVSFFYFAQSNFSEIDCGVRYSMGMNTITCYVHWNWNMRSYLVCTIQTEEESKTIGFCPPETAQIACEHSLETKTVIYIFVYTKYTIRISWVFSIRWI